MSTREDVQPSNSVDRDESSSENDRTSGQSITKIATPAPLQRRLKSRHLQMIAIGGTVGTGLVRQLMKPDHLMHMYMPPAVDAVARGNLIFPSECIHHRQSKFIGSGGALAKAGPAGALIAYVLVGSLVYSVVMVTIGEMTTYISVSGAQ